MADFGINWGNVQTPNILGSYLQGQQVRQSQQANLLAQRNDAEDRQMRRDEFSYRRQKDVNSTEAEAVQKKAEALTRVAKGLSTVPVGQRRAALQQAMPLFQQSGIDPSAFANLTEDQLTDQALSTFTGDLAKTVEEYTLTPGSARYRGATKVAEQPLAPEYKTVSPGESLVEVQRGGQPTAPAATGGDWRQALADAAPDARVTSGYRTPEHNAEVGGKPNSRHLTGEAVDLVPRPGETMAQLYARVSGVPGVKAINEGDHVHAQVAGGAQTQGGARVIAQGAPKPVEQWEDLPGGGQRNTVTGETKNVPQPKGARLSASAMNQQNEHLGALQTASAINTRLDRVNKQLDSGKLDLGIVKNVVAQGQNAIGLSSEASRNFASFRADLEKLRNDSLRLNKGVQTEGDAQRAWNELFSSITDPRVVKQRLGEIEQYNQQAIAFHQDMVTQIRDDAGMAPIDTNRFLAKPLGAPAAGRQGSKAVAPSAQQPVRVTTPQQAMALKPGTVFITPDGRKKVR